MRNTTLEHLILTTTYLRPSNATIPHATLLKRPNSAEATQSCDHRTKHLPSANSDLSNSDILDLPKQQSTNLSIPRTYGRPCKKSFNDFPFQWIWLEMMSMDTCPSISLF
jgi:hypothetical protein